MRHTFTLAIFFIILVSCESSLKKPKRDLYDRLAGDDYERTWINVNYQDGRNDESELYITNKGDTLPNQYKLFRNGKIDMKESIYYDLEISETNKPNIYRGKITLHSFYENLKLNKSNTRTVELGFCEQTKDSISIKYIESKTSNTIEFQFQNYYGKRLHGNIYQLVFRDTIVDGKKMLNMRQTKLVVDNLPITRNLFVDPDSIKKERKFNPQKLKLEPIK